MATYQSRSEARLGLPRASLSTLRSVRNAVDTEDEDSQDEYSDSEQQQAGAVSTTAAASNAAAQTEDEIASEYNKQKPKKRRVQRSLQPEQLAGDKGLMVLRQSFPNRFGKHRKFTKKDMPRFSRQLVQAYRDWVDELLPGAPLEEVATKLYTLNSKSVVRQHLQTLRNQVRNHHVERIYGLEKAEQLLEHLEHGLQQQEFEEEVIPDVPPQQEEGPQDAPAADAAETTPKDTPPGESSEALPKSPTVAPPVVVPASGRKHALEDSSDEEEELVLDRAPPAPKRRAVILEDSDDEEELGFEEPATASHVRETEELTGKDSSKVQDVNAEEAAIEDDSSSTTTSPSSDETANEKVDKADDDNDIANLDTTDVPGEEAMDLGDDEEEAENQSALVAATGADLTSEDASPTTPAACISPGEETSKQNEATRTDDFVDSEDDAHTHTLENTKDGQAD